MKTIITTVLLLLATISYGQETKTFKKDNISFEYPKHWVINNAPNFYILVNEPPEKEISVQTTFDVSLEEGYDSLEEYCNSYESKMAVNEYFKDFKVNVKKEILFKGMKAIEYNCTASVSFLPIEWKSVIFMKDGKVYKLSTTSIIGEFFLLRETTNKIFESFKID
jgi:predicted Zn-dependent protease